jgi:hypothetical protein
MVVSAPPAPTPPKPPKRIRARRRALKRLHQLHEKYEKLVWFSRSHPADDPSWDAVPAEIKRGALNAQARVQELYPDEIDRLRCPGCGDWHHGFNSGMLAATRLLMAYLHPRKKAAAWEQQIEDAEIEFPELDT